MVLFITVPRIVNASARLPPPLCPGHQHPVGFMFLVPMFSVSLPPSLFPHSVSLSVLVHVTGLPMCVEARGQCWVLLL